MHDDSSERSGPLGEKLKKAFSAGMGALLFTEESIRSYVKDAKLPRDIANYLVQNASRGKEELMTYVARELNQMVQRMDLVAELEELLRRNTIRIRADIEFIPKAETGGKSTEADIRFISRDEGEPEPPPSPGSATPPIEPEPPGSEDTLLQ